MRTVRRSWFVGVALNDAEVRTLRRAAAIADQVRDRGIALDPTFGDDGDGLELARLSLAVDEILDGEPFGVGFVVVDSTVWSPPVGSG